MVSHKNIEIKIWIKYKKNNSKILKNLEKGKTQGKNRLWFETFTFIKNTKENNLTLNLKDPLKQIIYSMLWNIGKKF